MNLQAAAGEPLQPLLDDLACRLEHRLDAFDNRLVDSVESLRAQWPEGAAVRTDHGSRLEAFVRNARAREAVLVESAADARVQAQVELARQGTQLDFLAARASLLAEALRHSAVATGKEGDWLASWADPVEIDRGIEGAGAEADLAAAIQWLAVHAEAALVPKGMSSFEVASARQWPDEVFVAAAYRWLLRRPVDDAGLNHYCRLLRCSMLRVEVLVDLAQSSEALAMLGQGGAIAAGSEKAFVMAAYDRLLDRGADTGGLNHYMGKLAGGATRASVLLDLAHSAECHEAASELGGALRTMERVNRRGFRIRNAFARRWGQLTGTRRQAWYAGRMAALDGAVAVASRSAAQRIDTLAAAVDERVAIARSQAAIEGASASVAPGATSGNPGIVPAPAEAGRGALAMLLGDTAAERSPVSIIGLIRSELQELGLD